MKELTQKTVQCFKMERRIIEGAEEDGAPDSAFCRPISTQVACHPPSSQLVGNGVNPLSATAFRRHPSAP